MGVEVSVCFHHPFETAVEHDTLEHGVEGPIRKLLLSHRGV